MLPINMECTCIFVYHLLLSLLKVTSIFATKHCLLYFTTRTHTKIDYTLWPFWVDTHVTPPFRKQSSGQVVDLHGQNVAYYPEVPNVLETLTSKGITLAVASRTGEIDGANQLLELFDWNKYFRYKEIYPGQKTTHFNKFKKLSGIAFEDMLFFDDEDRNIRDLTALNVLSILVKNGMSMKVLELGLEAFRRKKL